MGRPRLKKKQKLETVTWAVAPEMREEIRKIAEVYDASESWVVRRFITQGIEKERVNTSKKRTGFSAVRKEQKQAAISPASLKNERSQLSFPRRGGRGNNPDSILSQTEIAELAKAYGQSEDRIKTRLMDFALEQYVRKRDSNPDFLRDFFTSKSG